jgi:hypothetical protein
MVYELSEEAATRASKKGLTWVSACKSGEKLNFRYQIVLSFGTHRKSYLFGKCFGWSPHCFQSLNVFNTVKAGRREDNFTCCLVLR